MRHKLFSLKVISSTYYYLSYDYIDSKISIFLFYWNFLFLLIYLYLAFEPPAPSRFQFDFNFIEKFNFWITKDQEKTKITLNPAIYLSIYKTLMFEIALAHKPARIWCDSV